jgi:hypothetical protein
MGATIKGRYTEIHSPQSLAISSKFFGRDLNLKDVRCPFVNRSDFPPLGISMRKAEIIAAAFSVALSACAGRAPQLVDVVQAQDHVDCTAITTEAQANKRRIAELASEKKANLAEYLIIMDSQAAANQEIAALQSRQQELATLAEQHCKAAGPPPIPRPAPPRPQ